MHSSTREKRSYRTIPLFSAGFLAAAMSVGALSSLAIVARLLVATTEVVSFIEVCEVIAGIAGGAGAVLAFGHARKNNGR